jgi:nitroreductase
MSVEAILDVVKGRRSIRKYEEKEIPQETLDTLLEAVRWSPSWANTQCWEIVVVKSAETKAALQATLPPKGNPAAKAMVAAPVVLVICGKTGTSGYYKGQVTTVLEDWFMYDLGIATQTLCLTAHAMGLGTVVVGLFDHAKAAHVLGVPEGYQLVSMIPLGFPAKTGGAPKRRERSEYIHKEKF